MVTALMVSAPSLNSGRNVRPSKGSSDDGDREQRHASAITTRGRVRERGAQRRA